MTTVVLNPEFDKLTNHSHTDRDINPPSSSYAALANGHNTYGDTTSSDYTLDTALVPIPALDTENFNLPLILLNIAKHIKGEVAVYEKPSQDPLTIYTEPQAEETLALAKRLFNIDANTPIKTRIAVKFLVGLLEGWAQSKTSAAYSVINIADSHPLETKLIDYQAQIADILDDTNDEKTAFQAGLGVGSELQAILPYDDRHLLSLAEITPLTPPATARRILTPPPTVEKRNTKKMAIFSAIGAICLAGIALPMIYFGRNDDTSANFTDHNDSNASSSLAVTTAALNATATALMPVIATTAAIATTTASALATAFSVSSSSKPKIPTPSTNTANPWPEDESTEKPIVDDTTTRENKIQPCTDIPCCRKLFGNGNSAECRNMHESIVHPECVNIMGCRH